MTVYSPSQSERFIRCPRLWDYSRRWDTDGGHWMERAIGTAIHAGVAAHFRGLIPDTDHSTEDPTRAAIDTLRDEWMADEPGFEGAEAFVLKGLKRALALDIGARGATILAVEETYGEERCRLDLAYQTDQGITIVDWKYTHNAGDWVISKRLQEAEVSWQLRHYAWRVSQAFPTVPVVGAGIALIVGGPVAKARWAPVEITPALLLDWQNSAARVWLDIEGCVNGERYPRAHMGQACLMYGGCPLYDGCHRLYGDESRFHTLYQRREPK